MTSESVGLDDLCDWMGFSCFCRFMPASSWIHSWFSYMFGTNNTNLCGVSCGTLPYYQLRLIFSLASLLKLNYLLGITDWIFIIYAIWSFLSLWHGSEGMGHEKVDFAGQRERCSLEHWVPARKMGGMRQDAIVVLQTARSTWGRDDKRELASS